MRQGCTTAKHRASLAFAAMFRRSVTAMADPQRRDAEPWGARYRKPAQRRRVMPWCELWRTVNRQHGAFSPHGTGHENP